MAIVPKSYVAPTSGVKLELISETKDTVSEVASPIVNLPVVVNDPDTVTVSPEFGAIVLTNNLLILYKFRLLVHCINIIKF